MSHLTLKRRLRCLVDDLSLQFAFSSIDHRIEVTGAPVGCTQDKQRVQSMQFGMHRWRRRVCRGHPRSFALVGVLMAVLLEICGCYVEQTSKPSLELPPPGQMVRYPSATEQHLSFYGEANEKPYSIRADSDGDSPVRPPTIEARPLPWAIPESVYFVYDSGRSSGGDQGQQPVATAFVLSVPDREHRRVVRFLVTARHVVDPEWAHCAEKNPSTISLRLNRRSGGIGYASVMLVSQNTRRFFTPFDPTADVAIIPFKDGFIANLDEYRFIDVPFRLLPTDAETLQFRADQPVMTARVPPWTPHGSSSFPVFDAGVLSKMPVETVKVQCSSAVDRQPSRLLHVWFIDAGTPQGASGAPVYTIISRGTGLAKSTVLLGIQSAAWPNENAAGITPSFVLRDLVQTALHDQTTSLDFYTGPNSWPREILPSLY